MTIRSLKTSPKVLALDDKIIAFMQKWGLDLLRIALGIVYIWFGALKIIGVSPVADLIQTAYFFLPQPFTIIAIGVLEIIIGIGFLFKLWLKGTIFLMLVQMGGVMFTPVLAPARFFLNGNPLLLSAEGEFVVKNFVFIAAALVIGGYLCKPYRMRSSP